MAIIKNQKVKDKLFFYLKKIHCPCYKKSRWIKRYHPLYLSAVYISNSIDNTNTSNMKDLIDRTSSINLGLFTLTIVTRSYMKDNWNNFQNKFVCTMVWGGVLRNMIQTLY